jgi:hypothetical protein
MKVTFISAYPFAKVTFTKIQKKEGKRKRKEITNTAAHERCAAVLLSERPSLKHSSLHKSRGGCVIPSGLISTG